MGEPRSVPQTANMYVSILKFKFNVDIKEIWKVSSKHCLEYIRRIWLILEW